MCFQIDLTLKNEQDEYSREGIEWRKIDFFNNKVVCELIEGSLTPGAGAVRLAPGIFSLLDDVCATMHAESKGSEKAFTEKVATIHSNHPHWASAGSRAGFIVKHFAGEGQQQHNTAQQRATSTSTQNRRDRAHAEEPIRVAHHL